MVSANVISAPMISVPLKATNEIDWITPLKNYIRQTYGDDPERYAEECATLNRLRQDMRGAGKDSAAGRDLLYRYYGQLELLDLRFPVDENHIKISFTWFDAFTHKPTSQYSLAYEKASIIFNISAVLSCHAARQNRSEETGLKTAYHSFQASAGMFNYINENFLHAPSTDLSRETVSTLIHIMLAQGQEVFLEKQIADEKKAGLLAKLASQACYLWGQAMEGVAENVQRGIFERVWSQVCQIKHSYFGSLAQYYQAIADNDANSHGIAIARLQVAESLGKEASKFASSFPSSVSVESNLSSDTGPTLAEMSKRHLSISQEKLKELSKDNDFIYHQTVPSESSLSIIPKLPASKAIPVSELYAGQDIQRIIGPDIFQRIVPMAVTESASLYDEEKAKLVRAESERVETANGEMDASLDYLKLPGSLKVLKGGLDQDYVVDDEFRRWCEDFVGREPLGKIFDQLHEDKREVNSTLEECTHQLDMEESVCEKMRSKYGSNWTQQPSGRLTTTLRSDIRSYRSAIDEAGVSDGLLFSQFRQYESSFEEMQSAGDNDDADVLFQREMVKAGASKGKGKSPTSPSSQNLIEEDFGEGPSVAEQIAKVEELLKKLTLIKKDRNQVLKDLKEKVKNDDISNVLILNKKSITNQEAQLFQAELEKFRGHQSRLLQANHKQSSLMKELTSTYSTLLQDKRVRSEQSKYEALTRQQNSVLARYKKIHQSFMDLHSGLEKAKQFYSDITDSVQSLQRNVETFLSNRKSEGAQLINQMSGNKDDHSDSRSNRSERDQPDKDRERLKGVLEQMSRLSTDPSSVGAPQPPERPPSMAHPHYQPVQPVNSHAPHPKSPPTNQRYSTATLTSPYAQHGQPQGYPQYGSPPYQPPVPQRQSYSPMPPPGGDPYSQPGYRPRDSYQPTPGPNSGQLSYVPGQYQPTPQQTYYPPQPAGPHGQPPNYIPHGYVPPPPPSGPPPVAPQQGYHGYPAPGYGPPPAGYGSPPPGPNGQHGERPNSGDPWAGLNAWK